MFNEQIEYLSWDSDFFEKKIGRIYANQISNLDNILSEAQRANYQLVYVFGDKDYFIDDNILKRFSGHLADRKVLYEKKTIGTKENLSFISEYKEDGLVPELEQLAYDSGKFSRFKRDKNFRKDDFYRMYKIWMENSVKKQMADNIFVVIENGIVKGMVTLKIKNEKGHIGLIAVSPDVHGKGYGKALINACENKLFANGILSIDVPTQADNISACKFYEKCGFQLKDINNIYHFWILLMH